MLLESRHTSLLPLKVGCQLLVLAGQLVLSEAVLVHLRALSLYEHFQVLLLLRHLFDVLSESLRLEAQVADLLLHEGLVLLELRAHPLEALLTALLGLVELPLVVQFDIHTVTLFLSLAHGLVGELQLVGQMVNVPLERLDLGDVVLLLCLQLFDRKH